MKSLIGITIALLSFAASAANITVPAGGNIQTSINSAVSGDTVTLSAGTYATGFKGKTGVKITSSGVVWVKGGADMTCSQCSVTNIHFDHGSLWVKGDDVLIQGNEFLSKSNEDYSNVFGNRIAIRHNWFHGLKIPDEIQIYNGAYEHVDACQFWNNNGEVLRDFVFDDNILTDIEQGLFLANETGVLSSMSNITITNNVFWGTDFPNFAGMTRPSHGIFVGKASIRGIVVRYNTVYKCANEVSLYNLAAGDALVQDNLLVEYGTAYALPSGSAQPNRGTGNWDYTSDSSAWLGNVSGNAPDTVGQNPLIGPNLLGPSGDPFGSDAGYWPRNLAAKKFGRQSGTITPTPVFTATNDSFSAPYGASNVTLPVLTNDTGSGLLLVAITAPNQGGTATIDASGIAISYSAKVGFSGNESFQYTVKNASGVTASATVLVTVAAAPAANTPPKVTLTGPTAPIQLAAGQTTASFTVTANGSDAEGQVTYLWSGGTPVNNIQCNQPVGQQTYSCTVTDSGGLTATASLTVTVLAPATVNTKPTINVTGPTAPIQLAAGVTTANVSLTATASDAEGPVSVSWSTGASGPNLSVQQPVGTQTYTATATDSGGLTATASISVTVVAAPAAVVYDMFQVKNRAGVYIWVKGTLQTAKPPVQ